MTSEFPDPALTWEHPPVSLNLEAEEVHVFCARLDAPASDVASLRRLLTADEQARADRFRFQRDRDHFIVARGLLRTLLGSYLGERPDQVRFCYSPYGKPALEGRPEDPPLSFNVSHSHELALFAFTRIGRIGIDLEWIQPEFPGEEIAERFFSLQEVAALRTLPPEEKAEAFFRCWTRKEAYIKARGEGLSYSLQGFDVTLAPEQPVRLLDDRNDPGTAERWSLYTLTPSPDYAAALALEGHCRQLKCFRFLGF